MPANAWNLTKQTFSEYLTDNVPRLSAALAYYTAFAIAPLLVITIAILGFVLGDEAARGQVTQQVSGLVGPGIAKTLEQVVQNAAQHGSGVLATVISVIVLIVAATGVFVELQDSLNVIWNVKADPNAGWWATIRKRLLSLAMVGGIAFLLLASLFVSTALTTLAKWISGDMKFVAFAVDLLVSLAVLTALFAVMFKYLPDVRIAWKDVWLGAAITAALFTIGKYLLALYLRYSTTASVFGAAGSLAAMLIWVYYSSQILFLGAEFTQVWARSRGRALVPTRQAVRRDDPGKSSRPSPAAADWPAGRPAAMRSISPPMRRPAFTAAASSRVPHLASSDRRLVMTAYSRPAAVSSGMVAGALLAGIGTYLGMKWAKLLSAKPNGSARRRWA